MVLVSVMVPVVTVAVDAVFVLDAVTVVGPVIDGEVMVVTPFWASTWPDMSRIAAKSRKTKV